MPRRPPVRSVQYMSTATKDHPSGSLRVSDADRDRAIAELSEHYQAGRLTTEELEDRTGRALQARTSADLAALFSDLPRRQAPVTSAAPSTPASPIHRTVNICKKCPCENTATSPSISANPAITRSARAAT